MSAYESLAAPSALREETGSHVGTFSLLRSSARAHIENPQIPGLVAVLAILQYLVRYLMAGEVPNPAALARTWAPAPLDLFSDVSAAGGLGVGWTAAIIGVRVSAVAIIMIWLIGIPLKSKPAFQMAAVYAIGLITFVIPFGVSIIYFSARMTGTQGAIVWLAVLAAPIIHLGLTGFLAPAAARAIQGEGIRLVVGEARIWFLAALSTWLWMYWPAKIATVATVSGPIAFALAFATLFVQSVIYGAIALNARAKGPPLNNLGDSDGPRRPWLRSRSLKWGKTI